MREKLIELLEMGRRIAGDKCGNLECDSCPARGLRDCYCMFEADHLIANGVTFATENKWIPVTERLPEEDGKYLVHKNLWGTSVISTHRFAKKEKRSVLMISKVKRMFGTTMIAKLDIFRLIQ